VRQATSTTASAGPTDRRRSSIRRATRGSSTRLRARRAEAPGERPPATRRLTPEAAGRWAAGLLSTFGWWRIAIALAGGALLVVGIVLLISKIAGYTGFVDRLRAAELGWLLLCPVGEAIAYAGYVMLLRALGAYGGGPRLGRWLALRTVFASLGATRMVAAAGAGGIAILYWAYRRAGCARHEAIVRVLGLDILAFAVFGAAIWLAALAVELGRGSAPTLMTLVWLVVIPVCVAGAIVLVAAVGPREPFAAPAESRLRRGLDDVAGGLVVVRRLVAHPVANRTAVAGAFLYWFGDIFCLWAGLRAFDVWIGASALVLAFATGYVAIALPLPTGGVGGVDAAMTLSLIWVGVPVSAALLGVFTYRFFSFLLPTLPGIAALSTLPLLGRELRAAARSTASPYTSTISTATRDQS
jgi:uncharacterized membrane protein YbhN (UPF0104 family)